MNKYKNIINSNKKFWYRENIRDSADGILLYAAWSTIPQLNYGVSKTALTISKILNLKPKAILPLFNKNGTINFSKSMCKDVYSNRLFIIKYLFQRYGWFFKNIILINTKHDIINLRINNYCVGKHIYDFLLVHFKIPTIEKVLFKYKLIIVLFMLYCFYFIDILKNVKCVVIEDNAYIFGIIFEICKVNLIPCISPVNLNSFKISRFRTKEEYNLTAYSVEKDLLNEVYKDNAAILQIKEYFLKRYAGNIEQHDVISAYKDKIIRNKDAFFDYYYLDRNMPVVLVMSHVFCDAPHVHPGMIFSDYYDWFINTLISLKRNREINVLIKEHPSSYLYNEDMLVKKIIKSLDIDFRMIEKNESTVSILENADIVVTCCGTIGIEFACMGKPVILAAKPEYAGLGFTYDCDNIMEYENMLVNKIHTLPKLTEEQHRTALATAHIIFNLCENRTDKLEIGSEPIYRGRQYNFDIFEKEILNYNKIPLEEQYIYHILNKYLSSKYRISINLNK